MQKYQILKKLGSGSFGHVEKAQNIETKEIVAIKKLKKKYGTWEECLQLSQVKALRKLNHQNIIKLKEVIRVINEAYFVFQFIDRDLYKLITQRKQKGQKLLDCQIRALTKQIVLALQCIHKQGFFHRDLKPQNILISNEFVVKIIDFGIAKQIRSKPPFTEYVSTRWYRAPQILLRFSTYSIPVDIFALGCLVAEMYLMRPLFMGSSQMDQLSKICSILGSPTLTNWPQGVKQAQIKGLNFPSYGQISLSTVLSDCPSDAIDFLSQCLKWDPSKRISIAQMLSHPFLLKQSVENLQIQPKNDKKQYGLKVQSPLKKPIHSYKYLDKDDQFEQLLNNMTKFQYSLEGDGQESNYIKPEAKIEKKIQKAEDDDDWF